MNRFLLLSLLASCAVEPTSSTSQATTSCAEIPPTQELAGWRGEPLYDPASTRVATIAYRYDAAGHEFIAYGIDIDAAMVVFAMHGQAEDLDTFLHDVSADIASPIAFVVAEPTLAPLSAKATAFPASPVPPAASVAVNVAVPL